MTSTLRDFLRGWILFNFLLFPSYFLFHILEEKEETSSSSSFFLLSCFCTGLLP